MQQDLVSIGQGEAGLPALSRDEATTALLKLFSETTSRKEYLDRAVALLRDWSGCRCVGIRVLDDEGNIPYESYVGYSSEFWESESWLSVKCDQCICIRVIKGAPEPQDESSMTPSGSFRSGNTMRFIGRLTKPELARFRGVCTQTGFASLAVVPITYRGGIIGAVHMADEREGRVPAPAVEFIEMISPLMGEAINRFSLEEELGRNNDFQAAINSLLRLSLEAGPIEQILTRAQEILLSLSWLTFEPHGFIRLVDRESDFPQIPGYHRVPISSGYGILGYIFLQVKEATRQLHREEEMLASVAEVLASIITRHEMEERLLRAQRLEMAGRVAGQVAHDLNNLLTPLIGYPQLIKRQLPPNHPAVAYCDTQLKLAQQMVTINEDLLTLGRRGRLNQQPADLNYVVGLALSGAEDLPSSIQLRVELSSDLPQITAAPAQLLRAVSNLLTNAREAMESGGVLSVRTDVVHPDHPFGHHIHLAAGRYVRLTVSDTGSGIPSEIIDNIFDAFFTTKGAGGKSGSGLGLSIVQAIVDDHSGYVDVESQVGRGTTFSIYLPVREPAPQS